ncbi:hypothetical protein DSO57_1022441 [Entomophthora muscae]|uniref:Uncharacterized protein n=1 Tax=Entomophthora muscae TaxID=34485 RepID=A0ACC2TQQ6_9FUNG|nr:hypothetical protein DSO57_1022441 [Entomophthora muscae]
MLWPTLRSSFIKFGINPSFPWQQTGSCSRHISTSLALFLAPIKKPHHSFGNKNVEIGTEYENSVVKSLRVISIDTRTCGGPGDNGVDFRGMWSLPDKTTRLHIVGQCKAKKNSVQSGSVRDLESVVLNEQPSTIGVLVTTCGYSSPAISRFYTSLMPLILVTIPQVDTAVNIKPISEYLPIKEFIWNRKASTLLNNKLTVTKTYSVNTSSQATEDGLNIGFRENGTKSNLTFLFNGLPLVSLN